MNPNFTIAAARPRHIEALPSIERAAATLLKGYVPPSILEESCTEAELRRAQQEGMLWVALAGDTPVGFALVNMLAEDLPHLQEMDVSPEHGRRGLGTALLQAALDWLVRSGHQQMTLT